jgi:hypothetical protein
MHNICFFYFAKQNWQFPSRKQGNGKSVAETPPVSAYSESEEGISMSLRFSGLRGDCQFGAAAPGPGDLPKALNFIAFLTKRSLSIHSMPSRKAVLKGGIGVESRDLFGVILATGNFRCLVT